MPTPHPASHHPIRAALWMIARASGIVFLSVVPSFGQTAPTDEDVRVSSASDATMVRDELRRLRDEVDALRAEVASLRNVVDGRRVTLQPAIYSSIAPSVLRTQEREQVTPEAFEIVKAQVEEHAQTKVESMSKMPVRLFGTILSSTVVNTGEANWLENPNLVSAPLPGATSNGSMTSTLRESRIGINVGTIPVGSLKASGTLIMDFFGGVPNFPTGTVMGLPRLLYAYGRLEGDTLGVEVGQDHTMFSPRNPTSLVAQSFPLFFRSGNLYLRAPQARVEYRPNGALTFKSGIVAPIAGDFTSAYEFAPPPGAGERSKRPAVEGSASFGRGNVDSPSEFALGASGHYGWRRTGSGLDNSWAGSVDGNVRVGRIGASGEWFIAENAEMFGAAVSQTARSQGGWLEGRVALSARGSVNGGFGRDRPEDAIGRLIRAENRSAFVNTIWRLAPELAISVEYRWLETRLGLVSINRENHHVNAAFAVSF
jgi:hypothetical protein